MTLLVLVVDDEPDVEALFRQQFRREMRAGRFTMDFAHQHAGDDGARIAPPREDDDARAPGRNDHGIR